MKTHISILLGCEFCNRMKDVFFPIDQLKFPLHIGCKQCKNFIWFEDATVLGLVIANNYGNVNKNVTPTHKLRIQIQYKI